MNVASILKAEFERRQKKNSRYSLRSFANALGADPTALSRIMSGERHPTQATVLKFLKALGLEKGFHASQIKAAKDLHRKKKMLLHDPFDEQTFEKVFESKHIYVLTALRLSGKSLSEMKNKLLEFCEMSKSEFNQVIEDLKELGALHETKNGIEVLYKNKSTVPLPFTSEKRKSLQKEFLAKAAHSVDSVPFAERVNATLTISINKNDLPEIERILRDARIKVNRLAEKNRSPDAVYNICMAAYPILQT